MRLPAKPDPIAEREQEVLGDHLEPLRRGGRTLIAERPEDAETAEYRAWVGAAALAAASGAAPPARAPNGFTFQIVRGRDLWILAEHGRRRGASAVALRVGPAAPLVVEAPHTFFDQGTLQVALAVFAVQRARALIVNTSHRYGGFPKPAPPSAAARTDSADEESDDNAAPDGGAPAPEPTVDLRWADMAHAERSFFLTAHEALLAGFPGITAVQLHGFGDRSAPGVTAIVSAAGSNADLGRLVEPLRSALPDARVLAYPADIDKLGGTTNVQSRASQRAGAPFYHLEMSRTLRDQLVADPALRNQLAAAFSSVAAALPRAMPSGR